MAIKNYLKDVKEITAPLNWKSSPDSPPTQLAYVTKPEIDLLVKANLHGSMDGKPNKGPKGIISLDGFGVDDEDSVVSQAQQKQFNQNLQNLQESGQQGQYQVNTSQSSFDQPGAVIPTVFQQQNQMEQDQDKPIPGVSFGDQMGVTLTPEQAKQIKEEKEEKEETKKTFGDTIKSVFTMDELQQFTPLMLKKVQTELDKFIELGVKNPLTLRTLMMSNIGGGIFGKDQTYSDMEGKIVKPEDALNEDGSLKEGIRYTREGMEGLIEDRFGDNIFESLKMYAPDIGYTALGGYMPQTSGGLVDLSNKAVATKNSDGTYTTADGRIISKDQGEAFNKMVFDARMELDRMGKNPVTGNPQGGGQPAGFPGIPGIPSLPIPKPGPTPPDVYPLPPGIIPPFGRPPFGPPEGDKFEGPKPYNYFAQSPQYMPQYRFRGVPSLNTDAFNEELRNKFGMA